MVNVRYYITGLCDIFLILARSLQSNEVNRTYTYKCACTVKIATIMSVMTATASFESGFNSETLRVRYG